MLFLKGRKNSLIVSRAAKRNYTFGIQNLNERRLVQYLKIIREDLGSPREIIHHLLNTNPALVPTHVLQSPPSKQKMAEDVELKPLSPLNNYQRKGKERSSSEASPVSEGDNDIVVLSDDDGMQEGPSTLSPHLNLMEREYVFNNENYGYNEECNAFNEGCKYDYGHYNDEHEAKSTHGSYVEANDSEDPYDDHHDLEGTSTYNSYSSCDERSDKGIGLEYDDSEMSIAYDE
ncbi:hypothetical protein RND71_022547 [Anisodus tanguticus]|uniref:Uncharacterized protein n=1 Tax=Anisodus tanguticus TaxID=243964 RepID=A0AAE1RT59_9SOLA|nr:hypothetical protein RND71_022547 [Anisodus tanguticus]